MNRWLPLLIAVTLLAVVARPASAWVIIRVLPKGHVPSHRFPNSVTSLLRVVPPVHGQVMDGFSHYTCSLYFRGTQNNVQELLDDLGKVADINLVINIDRTGKVGLLKSGKVVPLERSVPFLYCVSLYQNDLIQQQQAILDLDGIEEFPPKKVTVTLTVYSAGGLKPDKLQIPKCVLDPHKLRAAKMTKTVVEEITSDLKLIQPE